MIMKSLKYSVEIIPMLPPVPQGDFFIAQAIITELFNGKTLFVTEEFWGKTVEEAHSKVAEGIRQWLHANEETFK